MLRVLIVAACVLVPAISFGQAGQPAPKEINVCEGEGELIEGTLDSPPRELVVSPHVTKLRTSLIKVRNNFNDKVVRSVSEL